MSVAWNTILIIALLMPGVMFLLGLWARERHSREIVKSTAVADVGVAIFIATVLHLAAWSVLSFFCFDLSFYLRPLADSEAMPKWLVLDHTVRRVWHGLWYTLLLGAAGFLLGTCAAKAVVSGPLRWLATHKWVYDLLAQKGEQGAVTVYIMTKIIENDRVLMYKGHLEEFYLDSEGRFTYVVLRNCFRYCMSFAADTPTTGEQLPLFKDPPTASPRVWDYLMIDGSNIANILFAPTGEIEASEEGTEALDRALAELLKKSIWEAERPVGPFRVRTADYPRRERGSH